MTSRYLRILDSVTLGLRRFPLVVLASIVATFAAILSNHHRGAPFGDECQRLILALALGFSLFVASSFARELHPGSRWIAPLLALFITALVWFLLPPKMEPSVIWYRYWMLFLTAVALTSLMPGTKVDGSGNWWRMNISLMNALVLSAIMTGVVLGGLELACFSVQKLFGLKMYKIFFDLFSFCELFVFPLCVICILPVADAELDASLPGFAVWGNLCKWALLPLGFLFIAILGVYAAQIMIQWKLPNGMVATPVLALGAYGTAAMLLLQPWRETHSWARWFARIYTPAFLLCSILLFISLEKRISTYGITFERYFALAAAIWFFLSALAFLIRLRKAVVFVPGLLGVMALIAALGPLSAGHLSLDSQSARLARYLSLPSDEKKKQAHEISSILTFLAQNYGKDAVEHFTGPLDLKPIYPWAISNKAMEKLGLKDVGSNGRETIFFKWTPGRSIATEGARALFVQDDINSTRVSLGKNAEGEELKILVSGEQLKGCVGSRDVAKIPLDSIEFPPAIKPDELPPIPMQIENRKFSIFLIEGNLEKESSGNQRLSILRRFIVLENRLSP